MAFGVFDSTVGGANTNSYASVAEFRAFFTLSPYNVAVAAMTDAEIQAALVYALYSINTDFHWSGEKSTTTQAQHFPAIGIVDCYGNDVDDETIPEALKIAQMKQAHYSTLIDPTQTPTTIMQGLKSAKVGSLGAEFDMSMTPAKMQSEIVDILRCYGKPVTNINGGSTLTSGYAVRG